MPGSRVRATWRRPVVIVALMLLGAGAVSVGSRAFNGETTPTAFRSPASPEAAEPAVPPSTSSTSSLPDVADASGGLPQDGTFRPGGALFEDVLGDAASQRLGPRAADLGGAVPPVRSGAAAEATATTAPAPPEPPPIVARPVPPALPPPPPAAPTPPWEPSTRRTAAGYVATDVGCADGRSAGSLDAFFAARRGPVLGMDYQHVTPLGGDRFLWLFQDGFLDHSGGAVRLDQAAFAHNVAMIQDGDCFTLLHRGSPAAPTSFEPGTGERPLRTWFWPMGGELVGDSVQIFWVQMRKTADPGPGDGLGWDPESTWLATYDADSLARTGFRPAPNPGVQPIYGYAVASDEEHTYLFGNTFDQNLADQGGFFGGPHSARLMYLARVARGQLAARPEYWTGQGWSSAARDAAPISDRFAPENPMQPRYLDGRWVAATKVGGYWGDELVIDVAADAWGPWHVAERRPLRPRGGDPLMNTYHAHLMPWLASGELVVSVSQNARDMRADAWPHPARYRAQFLSAPLRAVPAVPPPTTVAPTIAPPTTASPTTSTSTTTTSPPSTSTSSTTTTSTSTTTSTTSTSSTTTSTSPSTTDGATTTSALCAVPSSLPSSSQPSSTLPASSLPAGSTTTTVCGAP